MKYLLVVFLSICLMACQSEDGKQDSKIENENIPNLKMADADHIAKEIKVKPAIDGLGNDRVWQEAKWYPIDQLWLGKPANKDDFSGRFKIAWHKEYLYVLAEITDDVLMDIHEDGLVQYWDDDCLEIFIDENRSKGPHQFSHNAFAYHIALDYKVADFGTDSLPHYYNDHVLCKRTKKGNTYTWEAAISIYDDQYKDGVAKKSMELNKGKEMGFAIAYCDNDYSKTRENFYGSIFVPGKDKNQGYLDAGIFGQLILK